MVCARGWCCDEWIVVSAPTHLQAGEGLEVAQQRVVLHAHEHPHGADQLGAPEGQGERGAVFDWPVLQLGLRAAHHVHDGREHRDEQSCIHVVKGKGEGKGKELHMGGGAMYWAGSRGAISHIYECVCV